MEGYAFDFKNYPEHSPDTENYVSKPNLYELIKECGDTEKGTGFICLYYSGINSWNAEGRAIEYESGPVSYFNERGKTPEEAVAKLWLAMNKKHA